MNLTANQSSQSQQSNQHLRAGIESLAPLAVGLDEAARLVGLSRFTLRRRIRAGQLRALRVGNRYIVAVTELERFINAGSTGDQK